jgi:uncharacterized protein GlcG (DUF336 family)
MYGPSITAETAKTIAPAAIAEAKKNNWTMAIAIVDTHGELVYFERMAEVQQGSVDVAIAKARSAARFKRPTKVFQDGVAAGGEGAAAARARGRGAESRAVYLSWLAGRSSAPSARRAAPASRTASCCRGGCGTEIALLRARQARLGLPASGLDVFRPKPLSSPEALQP